MTEGQAIKGQELIDELKELRKINKLLSDNQHKYNVNVKFHQHFGDCSDYERVEVDKRHTSRFVDLLKQIISDVERELIEL